MAVTLLTVAALPQLLGRSDLWLSLYGRLDSIWMVLASSTPLQLLFGQGIASNSNQILSLLGPTFVLHSQPTDGMPSLLLHQGGILGLFSFYWLMLWAWRHDRRSRSFLLVIIIGSLTINIIELYPINLLLGLGLGHSLFAGTDE
jgi:hypothetical protein